MGVSHFVGFRVELYQRTQTTDMAYGTSVVACASRELKLKLYFRLKLPYFAGRYMALFAAVLGSVSLLNIPILRQGY